MTHGGIVKYELINNKGDLTTIYTTAYHNPEMNVKIFSPHAHFDENQLDHKSFELFFDKGIMHLGDGDDVEFPID